LKPSRERYRTCVKYVANKRVILQTPATPGAAMIHDVSIPAAFVAGIVSFLSPCVLPLVPPYLIYLTGATIEHVSSDDTASASKRAVMMSAMMFVAGFSTVFVASGDRGAGHKRAHGVDGNRLSNRLDVDLQHLADGDVPGAG
jgi:hypothetical protein